jgi:hypothetical protein
LIGINFPEQALITSCATMPPRRAQMGLMTPLKRVTSDKGREGREEEGTPAGERQLLNQLVKRFQTLHLGEGRR